MCSLFGCVIYLINIVKWLKNLCFFCWHSGITDKIEDRNKIVAFLCIILYWTLIHVLNFEHMKWVGRNSGPLAVSGRTPRQWLNNYSCSDYLRLIYPVVHNWPGSGTDTWCSVCASFMLSASFMVIYFKQVLEDKSYMI